MRDFKDSTSIDPPPYVTEIARPAADTSADLRQLIEEYLIVDDADTGS